MAMRNAKANGVGIKPINAVEYYRGVLLDGRGDLLNYIPTEIAMSLSFDRRCAEAMSNHPNIAIRGTYAEARGHLSRLDDKKRAEFAALLR